MNLIEILNRIGMMLCVPGPILFFWGCARLADGEKALAMTIIGGVLMVVGLVLGNFKAEWLYKE